MRNNPLFRQDLRLVLDAQVLDWSLFLKNYAQAAQIVYTLEDHAEHCSYLEHLWSRPSFLESNTHNFHNFRTILVVGRSEDISGMRCIVDWVQTFMGKHTHSFPEIHFIAHPDPELFWEIIGTLNLACTGIIIVCSNQNDMFPYIVLLRCIESWRSSIKECSVRNHIMVWIPKKAELLQICTVAQTFDLNIYFYSNLSPKSSACFNELSLTVAKIIGFHVNLFLDGAKKTCWQYFHNALKTPLEGAALCATLKQQYPHLTHWIWSVTQNFDPLSRWMQWLWQETLGHRYISPPRHITHTPPHHLGLTTTFWEKKNIADITFPNYFETIHSDHTQVHLKQLLEEEFKKNCKVLSKNGHAIRIFYMKQINEETLGALTAHFLLETTILLLMNKREELHQSSLNYRKMH